MVVVLLSSVDVHWKEGHESTTYMHVFRYHGVLNHSAYIIATPSTLFFSRYYLVSSDQPMYFICAYIYILSINLCLSLIIS